MDTLKVPQTADEEDEEWIAGGTDDHDGDGDRSHPVSFRTSAFAIVASLPSRSARHSPLARRRRSSVRPTRRRSVVLHPGLGADDSALFEKAARRGLVIELDDVDSFDEIARMQQVEIIREMAVTIQMKRRLRSKAFEHMPISYRGGWAAFWRDTRTNAYRYWVKLKNRYREFAVSATLWRGALKTVEGHFGGGVLTYFRFLKWLFCLNIYIFSLILIFVVIPNLALPTSRYSVYNSTIISSTDHVTRAGICSARYDVSVATNDRLQLVIDFLQGTGWMEKTVVFYGAYVGARLSLSGVLVDVSYNLPLAYILVVIAYFILSLVMIVHYTAAGMRTRILGSDNVVRPHCSLVFASWDYGLNNQKNCNLQHRAIYREITCTLEEERNEIKLRDRSRSVLCELYTKRLAINLLVAAILIGCGYTIYIAAVKNLEMTRSAGYAGRHPLVKLLQQYATSMTITALNVVVPLLFLRLVRCEGYSTAFEVNITLARRVFLRLASLGVLLFTLYAKINCADKDACIVGQNDCPALKCWETYVGQEFYKLVIMDFITPIGLIFFFEFPRRLIVNKFDTKITRMIGLQEFDIPKNVLDLIYTEVLLWFGSFFSPLLAGIVLVKCFVMFYLKKLSLLYNFTPSSRSHRASDSEFFFLIVLMVAYAVCITPIMYCIWRIAPSTGCGPFRIYDKMHSVIEGAVQSWPGWLAGVVDFIYSAAFIMPAFVVMLLIIYYINMTLSTYKQMTYALREQLVMEGQDKQFLLARIQDLVTGGKPRSAEQKPALTVNASRLTVESDHGSLPHSPQPINGHV